MECPKCKSERIFCVVRQYEYWTFEIDVEGHLNYWNQDDSVPDEDFDDHIWCEDCETTFKHVGKELVEYNENSKRVRK